MSFPPKIFVAHMAFQVVRPYIAWMLLSVLVLHLIHGIIHGCTDILCVKNYLTGVNKALNISCFSLIHFLLQSLALLCQSVWYTGVLFGENRL